MLGPVLVCTISVLASFQQSLESMISDVDNERAIEVSVLVETLDGELLFQHLPQRQLVLASNTKLFTTAAAIIELGEEFRWHTRVFKSNNDLAIVGGGDPSITKLNDQDFAQQFVTDLLQSLRAANVVQIDNLYIDASFFDEQRHSLWPLEHTYDYFCAPPSALSVASSSVEVGYDGQNAIFYPRIEPSIAVATYGKPSKFLSAWWADNGQTLWVRLPFEKQQAVAKYAVPDGVQFFGWWVRDELQAAGINVRQLVLSKKPQWTNQTLLLDYSSAANLKEVVHEINKESNNFMAEMVLKTLGAGQSQLGSYKNGTTAVRAILSEHLEHVDHLSLLDGSGMARSTTINNAASPQVLCELLRAMCFLPQGATWFESLPIGGVDGTIASRFKDDVFSPQRVHAKTGFIYSKQSNDGFGASSLSGYLLLPDDQIAVFSFIVNFKRKLNTNSNNRRFKSLQQQFFKQLIDEYHGK